MLQAPWFVGLPEQPHWPAVVECSQATAGDALITLLAFWGAAMVGSRQWPESGRPWPWMVYMALGLLATVVLERLNTDVWRRWAYAPEMPRLPWLGTGLLPVLQWLLLPPMVAWLARGMLRGQPALPSRRQPP
jgi:hypothetical protein